MQVSQLCAQECPSLAPRSERGKEMQMCATDTLNTLRNPDMACGGTTLENVCISIKLFRKQLVEVLTDIKGWSPQEVPKKLIILMRDIPILREMMVQITPVCHYDYDVCYNKYEVCMAAIPTYKYDDDTCAQCGIQPEKLKKCGKCKRVWYCGSSCQNTHWQRMHKRECSHMSGEVRTCPFPLALRPDGPAFRVMTA